MPDSGDRGNPPTYLAFFATSGGALPANVVYWFQSSAKLEQFQLAGVLHLDIDVAQRRFHADMSKQKRSERGVIHGSRPLIKEVLTRHFRIEPSHGLVRWLNHVWK